MGIVFPSFSFFIYNRLVQKYFIIIPFLFLSLITAYYFLNSDKPKAPAVQNQTPQFNSPSISSSEFKEYQASFIIYTNGTKRVFSDEKYHNRSQDVFITSENPSLINAKAEDTTWQNFFETLPSPMKITKTCLYTGSGQTFCNSATHSLKFFINGKNDPEILDQVIGPNQKLLISFGPINENVAYQFSEFE